MFQQNHSLKPVRGMTVAFKATASEALAGIPATVIDVWPRFRSGEYLVTLEYGTPVKFRKALIRHVDAFVSELDPIANDPARPAETLPAARMRGPLV